MEAKMLHKYAIVGGPDAYWVRDTATGTATHRNGLHLEQAMRLCERENRAEEEHERTLKVLRENDHG
jgi:hypothetical protein